MMNNVKKCDILMNKYVVCSIMNSKLPYYDKNNNCKLYYKKYMKECTDKLEKDKFEKDKLEKDKLEKDKLEKDKIFKCSIFSTY